MNHRIILKTTAVSVALLFGAQATFASGAAPAGKLFGLNGAQAQMLPVHRTNNSNSGSETGIVVEEDGKKKRKKRKKKERRGSY